MDRYDFVREWFNASSVAITKYTWKDAAADMRNLRADAMVDESPLPEGLSANYLYETINQLIKDSNAKNDEGGKERAAQEYVLFDVFGSDADVDDLIDRYNGENLTTNTGRSGQEIVSYVDENAFCAVYSDTLQPLTEAEFDDEVC